MLLPLNTFQDYGLLFLRIVLGSIFFIHGWSKVKAKTSKLFMFLGIAETLGAAASITGFLTQFAGIGFSLIMFGAIYMKKFKWGVNFTAEDKTGWEFDSLVLAAAIILILFGAGSISLDSFLHF